MGLISGIMIEKFGVTTSEELSHKAQSFIKAVPNYVQSGLSELVLCENVNKLITQIEKDTDLHQ